MINISGNYVQLTSWHNASYDITIYFYFVAIYVYTFACSLLFWFFCVVFLVRRFFCNFDTKPFSALIFLWPFVWFFFSFGLAFFTSGLLCLLFGFSFVFVLLFLFSLVCFFFLLFDFFALLFTLILSFLFAY